MQHTFDSLWPQVETDNHPEACDLAIDWVVDHTEASPDDPTEDQVTLQTVWELAYRLVKQGWSPKVVRSSLHAAMNTGRPVPTSLLTVTADAAIDNATRAAQA
jgi:hypothetical protein